jgi:hypothetical protein
VHSKALGLLFGNLLSKLRRVADELRSQEPGSVVIIFIVGMVAIGTTQCGSSTTTTTRTPSPTSFAPPTAAPNNGTGCFLGMFLFGFFGGFMGILAAPMMYWTILGGHIRKKQYEAQYKVLESRKGLAPMMLAPGGIQMVVRWWHGVEFAHATDRRRHNSSRCR